jgi:uncharacterized membrane protein
VSTTPVNWHKAHKQKLTPGERAADHMRNGMGSWRFVFSFITFMVAWAIFNTIGLFYHWDNYPFILLNLFLSMLAGLQGAILLIAAKRQDSISAAMAEHDYQTNLDAKAEIEELMAINRQQLVIIKQLHTILEQSKTE